MNEYDVKVYFEKNKIYTNLDVLVQHNYNSTKLNFTFDKEGRVLFKLKAPNGDNILNTQVVNNEVILEPGVLNQVGDYEAEISLYGNDSKLTNYQTLNFYVRDVLINTDEIIEPSYEKEILDQLINDVNTLDSTVTSNEATRQSNEQTRVSNENTRISNEETRQSNETAREEYIDQLKQDVEDGKFDGKDGEDGYTPQKGIDYYTEEEKEEMIDYIVNDANSEFNRNVNEKTTAFNTNATNKTTDFNSNASSKLDTYNSNHTSKMNAYNQNATDKTTAFDTNATNKTTAYDNNASSKLTAYNDNATEKLSAYNTNHTEKLQAYNDNASDKLDEYNDNAQEKIDEFNENKEELQRAIDYYKSTLNALPKVEGEGTSLTLDDTAEAPMPMKLVPSELEQETTTGNQLFNIADGTYTGTNGSITFKDGIGTLTLNSGATDSFRIDVPLATSVILNANQSYTRINGSNDTYPYVSLFYNGTQIDSMASSDNGLKVFTPENDTTINMIRLWVAIKQYGEIKPQMVNGTYTSSTMPLFEKFTYGPSPNPDYPQDIHTISGDNEIKVGNINLWGGFTYSRTDSGISFTHNLDGSITAIGTASSTALSMLSSEGQNHLLTLQAGTYTLSGGINANQQIQLIDSNGTEIASSGSTVATFTLTESKQIWIRARIASGQTVNTTYKVQLKSGISVTSYTPYQKQSLPLNLPVENLFDISKVPTSTINITGTNEEFTISQKSNNTNTQLDIQFEENKQYTFSGYYSSTKANGSIRITYTDTTTDNVFAIFDNSTKSKTKFSFTSNSLKSISFVEFRLFSEGNYTIYDFQIEQGTKANSFTPFGTPALEYCKMPNSNFEDEFVLPKNNLLSVPFSNSSANNLRATLDNFKAGNYIFSFNITSTSNQYQVTAKKLVNGITTTITAIYNTPKLSFNLDEDATLILDIYRIGILPEQVSNIMLNLGTIELPYEPYNPNGKWYLKKNVGKVVLDENSIINASTKNENYAAFYISKEDMKFGSNLLSNYFTQMGIGDATNARKEGIASHNSLTRIYLVVKTSIATTIVEFKEWLSTHNTDVYYSLSTPQYILLNDTLQSQLTEIYNWVKAYQEQTNISQVNNDLPFVIKASAVKDLNKVIASLTNAIIEIGGE